MRINRFISIVHILLMVIWASAIISAAVSAMNVFPTMRDMDVYAARFEAMARDEHGMLIAGVVMNGIFRTVDVMMMIVAPIAMITGIAVFYRLAPCPRSWSARIHIVTLVLAGTAAAVHLSVLAPSMYADLHAFWSSIESGELEQAATARAAFEERHHLADALLRATLFIVLASIGAFISTLATNTDGNRPSCRA